VLAKISTEKSRTTSLTAALSVETRAFLRGETFSPTKTMKTNLARLERSSPVWTRTKA
jgi:hypothetical protein